MEDLKDMCLIDKKYIKKIGHLATMYPHHVMRDAVKDIENIAYSQDLNGMVVVPVEPTDRMRGYGDDELPEEARGFGWADDVYKAMIAAAPKLGE